jgi:AcrR family transcriptional regulator
MAIPVRERAQMMPKGESSPSRGRGRDRREEIKSNASRLFCNQGFHATTIDDIAEAVKLTKGTFYHYYEGKGNLLFEILLDTHDRRLTRIPSQQTVLSPTDRITTFIEETMADLADHPYEGAVLFQEAPFVHQWLTRDQVQVLRSRQSEFDGYLVEAVRAGQIAGTFDGSLDSRVVTSSLEAIVSWFIRWYKPSGRLSARDVAQQSSKLILTGLLGEENR